MQKSDPKCSNGLLTHWQTKQMHQWRVGVPCKWPKSKFSWGFLFVAQ